MNTLCNVEFAEYEGQYTREASRAIVGCNCPDCKSLREEWEKPKPLLKFKYDKYSNKTSIR